MIKKERIESFDYIKYVAILLVVWGHCIGFFIELDHTMNWAYTFIYSFHMPLFMMVTGFFGAKLYKNKFVDMVSKKFTQLLLPVFSFGLLLSLYHVLVLRDGVRLLYGFYIFWFLPSAFMCALLFYIATKNERYRILGIILMLLFSQVVPVISTRIPEVIMQFVPEMDLQRMFPCYVAGACLNNLYSEFKRYRKRILVISLLIYLSVYLVLVSPFRININWADTYVIGLVKLIGGIGASIALIAMVEILAGVLKKSAHYNIACSVGRKTLGIYIIHSIIMVEIIGGLFVIDMGNEILDSWLICLVLSLLIMGICYGMIKMIEQSRVLSYLLLGKGTLKEVSLTTVVGD
jgi:fucose 4-O-acetylase-like acetyltransferase